MKSTAQLTKENNVKALRLNNTDREIFENYMTYVRADLRVNPHDSELMLNRTLKHLIRAGDTGMLAMEFSTMILKHMLKKIRALPNETFKTF